MPAHSDTKTNHVTYPDQKTGKDALLQAPTLLAWLGYPLNGLVKEATQSPLADSIDRSAKVFGALPKSVNSITIAPLCFFKKSKANGPVSKRAGGIIQHDSIFFEHCPLEKLLYK